MKKTIFIIILLFIISLFIHIPNYLELNDLIIIDKIDIDCENKTINYNEVIPYKDNNSIDYKYKEVHINKTDYKRNEKYLSEYFKVV